MLLPQATAMVFIVSAGTLPVTSTPATYAVTGAPFVKGDPSSEAAAVGAEFAIQVMTTTDSPFQIVALMEIGSLSMDVQPEPRDPHAIVGQKEQVIHSRRSCL
ncbi:hypothetical protein [Streptomyces clavifer]|uniref:hypothetical protein n=1 Tax=Streptomyces clavifer TaxID=68188 RepID=UPI002E81E5E8|nr:hypothetical protein [Streptomyces clavifer]WUC32625.1 hypothetical protein OG927_35520 [Streptomyces clavifer]